MWSDVEVCSWLSKASPSTSKEKQCREATNCQTRSAFWFTCASAEEDTIQGSACCFLSSTPPPSPHPPPHSPVPHNLQQKLGAKFYWFPKRRPSTTAPLPWTSFSFLLKTPNIFQSCSRHSYNYMVRKHITPTSQRNDITVCFENKIM